MDNKILSRAYLVNFVILFKVLAYIKITVFQAIQFNTLIILAKMQALLICKHRVSIRLNVNRIARSACCYNV